MSATDLVTRLHAQGLTFTQISQVSGMSRVDTMAALQDAGVSKKSISNPTELTSWAEAVLLGTMLGDGNIRSKRPSESPHFQMSHALAQKEYLCWKVEQLEELFLAAAPASNVDEEGHASVHVSSRAMPLLKHYRQLFYPNEKKKIDAALLSRVASHDFRDAILAVWFGDDGYRTSGNGRSLGFCLGGLEEQDFELIALWLTEQGFDGVLHKHMGRASYRYYLMRVSAAHRFRDVIAPYLPECMHYKLDIGPPRKIRRSRVKGPVAVVSDENRGV